MQAPYVWDRMGNDGPHKPVKDGDVKCPRILSSNTKPGLLWDIIVKHGPIVLTPFIKLGSYFGRACTYIINFHCLVTDMTVNTFYLTWWIIATCVKKTISISNTLYGSVLQEKYIACWWLKAIGSLPIK